MVTRRHMTIYSHCAHVWVKTGEDDLSLVGVAVDHFQNNVCHLVALKVSKAVLGVNCLWDGVLYLNIEANVRGKTLEDLCVCVCVSK